MEENWTSLRTSFGSFRLEPVGGIQPGDSQRIVRLLTPYERRELKGPKIHRRIRIDPEFLFPKNSTTQVLKQFCNGLHTNGHEDRRVTSLGGSRLRRASTPQPGVRQVR